MVYIILQRKRTMLPKKFKEAVKLPMPRALKEAQEKLLTELREAADVLDLDKGAFEAMTGNAYMLCDLGVNMAQQLSTVSPALPLASNIITSVDIIKEIAEHTQNGEYGRAAAATGAG